MKSDLEPKERDQLAAAEASVSSRATRPLTFDSLLARWSDFVEEVEDGYADSIDDYANDLTTRDSLERLLSNLPPELAAKLTADVAPIDRRFERATTDDDKGMIRKFFNPRDGWWWTRLPRKIEGTLAATLGL